MGSGLNNSLKYSLLMDSRNGWYYAQRIAIALTAVLAIYSVQMMDSGAKGYAFLSMLFYWSFFLITFISCSIFGDSITEEKEQGILPLVMMTGTKPATYLSAKFLSKTNHLLFLLLILIPPTIFAVTMGGVSLSQIVFLYVYLLFWFLFCGSICFWLSVLFSEKKEVRIISGPLIVIIMTAMAFAGISPFQRISFILNNPSPPILEFKEFFLIIPICIYLFISACRNMNFGILFPIKFFDEYLDRVKAANLKIKHNPQVRLRKKVNYYRKDIIKARDEFLIPVKSLWGDGLKNAEALSVIVFIVAIPFIFPFFVAWMCFGPFILVWKRVIDVFSLEIEENTLTSLCMLPMSTEELLDAKVKAATPYMGVYLVYGFFSFPLLIVAVSLPSLHISLIIACSVFLYYSLIYITVLITLKAKDMVKATSFSICFFTIMLFFFTPFLSFFFIPLSKYLKKLCVKEINKIAEISD